MRKPNPIKLSSLDLAAPAGVEIMIRLHHPSEGRRPPVRIHDYPASEIEAAQRHSDFLKKERIQHGWVTWWRLDGKHVRKMPTMKSGTMRNFRVRVPYVEGMSDAVWKEAISKGLIWEYENTQHEIDRPTPMLGAEDFKVTIDNTLNRNAVLHAVWDGATIVATGTAEECLTWVVNNGETPVARATYRVRPLVFAD